MTRRLGWLLVPLLAVLVWWIVRGGDPTTQATHATSAPPAATERSEHAEAAGTTSAASRDPAPPDRATSKVPSSGSGITDPPAHPGVPSAARPAGSATPPVGAVDPARPALPAAGSGDSPSGGLTDKTGWDDKSAIKQLNKELMPLVSECIDQAKARKPRLHGTLGLSMTVAPTDNNKVIVSVKPTRANQIEDTELLECIRESSFSIEGLTAPHDFEVSMPID
jgi:hypothetical protein